MKKQRWTNGAFVEIRLKDNRICYGQLVNDSSIAIFDIITDKEYSIKDIPNKSVLFIVAIYRDVITSGKWLKIGHSDLPENLLTLPFKFIQDALNPNQFSLYNPNTGEIIKAKRSDCEGLERAAIWEAEHVESRIIDHFSGTENIWLQQMLIK